MQEEQNDADVGQAEVVITFASYVPRNPQIAILGKQHPDPVVESSALASVAAPKIDFSVSKLGLPQPIIVNRLLSNLQLESILYANYRHSIFLPGKRRSGFLLGDGAGIGKGRQIAGLVYDNYIRGRTKALWFSASTDLKNDAGQPSPPPPRASARTHACAPPCFLVFLFFWFPLSGVVHRTCVCVGSTTASLLGDGDSVCVCVWGGVAPRDSNPTANCPRGGLAWRDPGRDFKDIGARGIPIVNLVETDARKPLHPVFPNGVVFSTYSCMISGNKNDVTRLQQLINWCSAGDSDFDGVIVFDECHKAKAVNLKKFENSSKTAQAVTNIQKFLPRARVVYVSATGASELSHLAYMDRLGLWGQGTAFEDAGHFKNSIEKRGVGAMELVAMDMKARGLFLARTLSYTSAEFGITSCEISEATIALYDRCCAMWMKLREYFDEEINVGGKGVAKGLNSQYWGCHQRFFKGTILAPAPPS